MRSDPRNYDYRIPSGLSRLCVRVRVAVNGGGVYVRKRAFVMEFIRLLELPCVVLGRGRGVVLHGSCVVPHICTYIRGGAWMIHFIEAKIAPTPFVGRRFVRNARRGKELRATLSHFGEKEETLAVSSHRNVTPVPMPLPLSFHPKSESVIVPLLFQHFFQPFVFRVEIRV